MIGQQLQRNNRYQRREDLFGSRHFYHMVGKAADDRITGIYYSDYFSFTGLYFLDIGYDLFISADIGSQHYNRHFLIYKRDRTMLHFSSRISFGMYIRYLFKLQ